MSTPFVKVDTVATTTVKCKCPLCGKYEWTVSHLFHDAAKREEGFYPVMWDCKKCNAKFDIRIYADKHVEMSQTGTNEDPFIPAIIVLRSSMVGTDGKPIYAVVSASSFKSSLDQEKEQPRSSHMEYYYNESTCPTNWFRDVIALVQDGDPDPHGCFEFVGARPRDELIELLKTKPDADHRNAGDPDDYIENNLDLIFPELFGGGETIDGESVMQSILNAPVPTNVQKVIAQGSMDRGESWIVEVDQNKPDFGRGLVLPDTIEDSYAFSEDYVKKVVAEGGVITANGIVPKESLAQATGEAEVRQSTNITIEPFNHADQE